MELSSSLIVPVSFGDCLWFTAGAENLFYLPLVGVENKRIGSKAVLRSSELPALYSIHHIHIYERAAARLVVQERYVDTVDSIPASVNVFVCSSLNLTGAHRT